MQQQNLVKKRVRIFAFEQNERTIPMRYTVPKNESGKFITGQQNVLSEEQMLGKKPVTKNQAKMLFMQENDVYVINPEKTHPLVNGRLFNLDHIVDGNGNVLYYVNPKDYAEFTFFTSLPEVTQSKNDYIKFKTLHYIEDKEVDARQRVHTRSLKFEAEKFVRSSMSIKRMRDLALLLGHLIKGVTIDPDTLSSTQLEDRIYQLCDSNPQEVLLCREGDSDRLNPERLFALKAIKIGEIVHSEGAYFYGANRQEYIGDTFESVLTWLRDDNKSSYVARIGAAVKEYDDKVEE